MIPGDSRGQRLLFSYGQCYAESESELEIMLHFVLLVLERIYQILMDVSPYFIG